MPNDGCGMVSGQTPAEALGEILATGLQSLHKRAYRLLGNAADAEDAVHDALLAAYTHLDQFKGQAKMSTWLTVIVHNSALMQLRKRLHHVHLPLDQPLGESGKYTVSDRLADARPSPEDQCRISEQRAWLKHLPRQLTPSQRRAFQLRDIEGLSIRETAQILGVPHGTVKAQSARARKKLKDLMQRALRPRSRSSSSVFRASLRRKNSSPIGGPIVRCL